MLEWRSGTEKDLDNVLQIPNVFLSVSKGQVAPTQDLTKAFGAKTKLDDIILEILNKGDIQVGEKERHAQLDRIHREVLDIIASKLVDPSSKRVYTTGMLEKALDQLSVQGAQAHGESKETPSRSDSSAATNKTVAQNGSNAGGKEKVLPTWTGVVTNRSAKSQALDAMKALITHQPIPISRARMRLRITCPTNILKQHVKPAMKADKGVNDEEIESKPTGTVKDRIMSYVEQIESQDMLGDEWELIGFVEPGAFKPLSEFVATQTKGRASADILDMAVVHED